MYILHDCRNEDLDTVCKGSEYLIVQFRLLAYWERKGASLFNWAFNINQIRMSQIWGLGGMD